MSSLNEQPAGRSAYRGINVAAHLAEMASRQPDRRAIVWRRGAGYSHWTFRELNEESDRYLRGLSAAGIVRGMRTILMVRPSPEFFALTFALYKIGAVPVLIDPGMGMRRMAECLAKIEAEAFIGVPLAHVLRTTHPRSFASVRIAVTVGPRWAWGGHTLRGLRSTDGRPFEACRTDASDPAAIIFTTGSTGPPKAVLYTHGNFDAQVRILRDHFKIEPGEIDLPTFPLFALFDPALGMTAVIPEMDPTRPAMVDPTKIIQAVRDQQVTHMFGSPALLRRVGIYGREHNIKLPSLRRVISAGAAVPADVLEMFAAMLESGARIHTPYGATEALPVTSIDHSEVLSDTRRFAERGVCVGRPVAGAEVRIIGISDEPIEKWSDDLAVPSGQIGEIVVNGPMVTSEYVSDREATRRAKIDDESHRRDARATWHRMGDVGWQDEAGRIWFCGRKAHRVQTATGTLFTEPVEAIFGSLPGVKRTALVGTGSPPTQTPVIILELESEDAGTDKLGEELYLRAGNHDSTREIKIFLFHYHFPVDIRHNSKIFREKLAVWAAKRLGQSR